VPSATGSLPGALLADHADHGLKARQRLPPVGRRPPCGQISLTGGEGLHDGGVLGARGGNRARPDRAVGACVARRLGVQHIQFALEVRPGAGIREGTVVPLVQGVRGREMRAA